MQHPNNWKIGRRTTLNWWFLWWQNDNELVTCLEWSSVAGILQDLLQIHETYLWFHFQTFIIFNFNEHIGSTKIIKDIDLDKFDRTSPTSSVFLECKIIVERFPPRNTWCSGEEKRREGHHLLQIYHSPKTNMAIKKITILNSPYLHNRRYIFTWLGVDCHFCFPVCNCNYKTLRGFLTSSNILGVYAECIMLFNQPAINKQLKIQSQKPQTPISSKMHCPVFNEMHPPKLTCQWKTHQRKMYFQIKLVIFQCHVTSQNTKSSNKLSPEKLKMAQTASTNIWMME